MKISYKTLKRYLPNLPAVEETTKKIVMHLAEVEDIHSESKSFENIVYGKIKKIETHENADSLRVCMVDIWENEETQIVCGWSNLEVWQAVAVAKIWASVLWHWVWEPVIMKKTAIRWVDSLGMICAAEEIWLGKEFPSKSEKEILDLSSIEAKTGTNLAEILKKDDAILEIDNKAINHRPDMFSHISLIRELSTIYNLENNLDYEFMDFSKEAKLEIKNHIPKIVKRYMWLYLSWVENTDSPNHIIEVLNASNISSKWILVDISNYSLYFYGQPLHCFDADKISWNIEIRFAKIWEEIEALDDKTYKLSENDIIIADSEKVLAIAWIIWWKSSAVSENTKNIIIEAANFPQEILRKSGRNLWVRTDALNVFEKDIPLEMPSRWLSLAFNELKKIFPNLKINWCTDIYEEVQKQVEVDFDINFINNLIWAKYSENEALEILKKLGIENNNWKLKIPFWRKELNYKADIAEEIARIKWYDSIETTIPRVNLWAVMQSNTYKLKNDSRSFFTGRWFFEMYNYTFINKNLAEKCNMGISNSIPLKNYLSEEMTHLRPSLIPNLLLSIESNIRDTKKLDMFEFEKIFNFDKNKNIIETYSLAWVFKENKTIVYYDIQNIISDFLKTIWIDKFSFENTEVSPDFAHKWRVSKIIARGKEIWFVWEIHPSIAKKFDVTSEKIGFFEINADILKEISYNTTKYKEISNYQENNFDLSFVVEKETKWSEIKLTIEKSDNLIKKVELFDIYENEEKLSWKRSLSFKIYIQSLESSLDDNVKWELIKKIIENVSKKGWVLR